MRPWLARWASCDPLLTKTKEPYGYCRGNPLCFSDKSGQAPGGETETNNIAQLNDFKAHSEQGLRGPNNLRSEHPTAEGLIKLKISQVAEDPAYAQAESKRAYRKTETLMTERSVAELKDPLDISAIASARKKAYLEAGEDILMPSLMRWLRAADKAKSLVDRELMIQAWTTQGMEFFRRLWRADTYRRMGGLLKNFNDNVTDVMKTATNESAYSKGAAATVSEGASQSKGFAHLGGAVGLALIGVGVLMARQQANEAEESGDRVGAVLAWSTAIPIPMVAEGTQLTYLSWRAFYEYSAIRIQALQMALSTPPMTEGPPAVEFARWIAFGQGKGW
jgi:hypothetical protein